MKLGELLRSDLERYFHYYGQPGRTPRRRDMWRSFLLPRCLPVTLYRLSQSARTHGWTGLSKLFTWLNFYLHNVEISAECEIGPYFFMPHVAGSVIGAQSIGHHAVIYHQVTIGAKSIEHGHVQRPRIGDHAFIASGARVIGPITLGDGCTVGANAVVTRSFPSGVVLTGIPATARSPGNELSGEEREGELGGPPKRRKA